MTTDIRTDQYGTICYYNEDDEYHREDGPALIYTNGTLMWYQFGKLHRDDGPALTHTDGYQEWWLGGQLHRSNGPAIITADGEEHWWVGDKLHRTDGPAVSVSNGYIEWWFKGKEYDFIEWCKKANIPDQQQTLLMLKYSPSDA